MSVDLSPVATTRMEAVRIIGMARDLLQAQDDTLAVSYLDLATAALGAGPQSGRGPMNSVMVEAQGRD